MEGGKHAALHLLTVRETRAGGCKLRILKQMPLPQALSTARHFRRLLIFANSPLFYFRFLFWCSGGSSLSGTSSYLFFFISFIYFFPGGAGDWGLGLHE